MTRTATVPRLGIGANAGQFGLLVVINAFVGGMVGLERTVLPLLASQEFGVATASATLSFLVAFGVVKAGANLTTGFLSDRIGRRPLLLAGWVFALPVAPMIMWAPSWGWVVAANVLLGCNQGLAWSSTVIMKIDLAGPRRRGLAMGINEVAGYGAVAIVTFVSAALAAAHGPRYAPYLLGVGLSVAGFVLSLAARETIGHARVEDPSAAPSPSFRSVFTRTSLRDRSLASVCQAGLVTNLNDALVWGLLPVYLAGQGVSLRRIGVVAAAYPAAWGLAQVGAGAWSDRVGRKPLIVGGMWLQAAGIASVLAARTYTGWLLASIAMGLGTALVYPTLLAAVGDAVPASWRASAVGVYRLWRDLGYAVGALVAGVLADLYGIPAAIGAVAGVTGLSGVVVAARMRAGGYPGARSTLTEPS